MGSPFPHPWYVPHALPYCRQFPGGGEYNGFKRHAKEILSAKASDGFSLIVPINATAVGAFTFTWSLMGKGTGAGEGGGQIRQEEIRNSAQENKIQTKRLLVRTYNVAIFDEMIHKIRIKAPERRMSALVIRTFKPITPTSRSCFT